MATFTYSTVSLTGSGLVFNNTFSSDDNAAFQADVVKAENFFQEHITNAATINIYFDVNASVPSGDAAINYYQPVTNVSFKTLVTALQNHVTSADQQTAVDALTAMLNDKTNPNYPDPSGGAGFSISVGMAQSLGITIPSTDPAVQTPPGSPVPPNMSVIDDAIAFSPSNTGAPWSFSSASPTVKDGSDVIGVLEHEISEGALGRIGSLGVASSSWAPMDLFRYNSSGKLDVTPSDLNPTYFSINGSQVDPTTGLSTGKALNTSTSLQFHNQYQNKSGVATRSDKQDFADWDGTGPDAPPLATYDPFGPAFYTSSTPPTTTATAVSATDLAVLQVLGWAPPAELSAGPNVYLSKPTASKGGSDQITLSVTNNGQGNAGKFTVGIYLSANTTITTSDLRVGTATITSLGYGQTVQETVNFNANLPSNYALGAYHVGIIVDPDKQLIDSNLTNNVSGTVGITITKPAFVWQSPSSGDWSAYGWGGGGTPHSGDVADMSVTGSAHPPYTVLVDNYTYYDSQNVAHTITSFAADSVILGDETVFEINPSYFNLETGASNSGNILVDNVLTIGTTTANSIVNFSNYMGPGLVTLNDATNGTLTGRTATTTLDLQGQTIQGGGSITNLQLVVFNNSKIDATGQNYELTINTGSDILNNGVIGATGTSGLLIENSTIRQDAFVSGGLVGVINASGSAAHVDLQTVHIEGGQLSTSDLGVIQTRDTNSILDGSTTAGAVDNLGYVLASVGNTLTLKGVIENSGYIAVQGGTLLALDTSSKVVLTSAPGSAGGYVQLDDNPSNTIAGVGGAAATLDNVNNTISGSGQISGLTLINEAGGTIDATGTTYQLIINNTDTLENSGLIEATGAAGLNLSSQTIDSKLGGSFTVGDGSQIVISSDTFIGGTFEPVGTGKWVLADPNNVLDGSVVDEAITNKTTLTAAFGNTLTLKGVIHNDVEIALQGGTLLALDPTAGVTLDGGGKVTLDDNPSNTIAGVGGAAATLTNIDNTISGSGQFSGLTIVNKAGGTIDATGAVYQLIINNTDTLQNSGHINATGAAGLNLSNQTIDSKLGGSFTVGDGSQIVISSDTFIGGTFAPVGTGKWVLADPNNVLDGTVTGEAITNKTTLTAAFGNTLTLKGVIHNDGEIALQGGTLLALDPTAGVTLDGGGKVTLDDNPSNTIAGVGGAAATLDNVDNTISGSGQFSGLTLINEAGGTIDATGANYQLVINNSEVLQNFGLIEATGAAGLNLSGQTIDTKLGGIFAVGDGSVIDISSDTFIGGTFAPVGTGKWIVADANNVLDGSVTGEAITNKATLTAAGGNTLTLKGVIHNEGAILLQGGTLLALDPTTGVMLDGGGKVTLDDNPSNTIAGTGGVAATLTNVDNTISGSGQFQDLTIVNKVGGTIEATGATYQLVINNTDTLQNYGVIKATGAAGLNLSSQTIDSKLGGSFVVGDGSQIVISSDTFIGGTFAPVGTGKWVLADPNNVLDGSVSDEAITNKTTLTAAGGNTLTLKGVIHNDGEIALQGGTLLALDPTAGVTLDGGGKVTLDDNPSNTIAGVGGAAATLDNVDNTISGSGQFSGLKLINEAGGTINATGANYQLVINNSEVLQNFGLIEATGAAGLNLSGQTIDTKSGGSFAVGDGSVIDISSDTFIGGTFAPSGTGKWIVADAHNVLDGSVTGEAITNKATLTAASGNTLTLKGVIHNDGAILLQGGTLLAIDPTTGVMLDGGGKVTLDDNPSNTIAGTGGVAATLTNVDNTISGSGQFQDLTIVNEAGGTIEATGANYQLVINNTDTLQNSGTLEATGADGLNLSGQTIDANLGGSIVVGDGSQIVISSDTFIGGTFAAVGSGKWVLANPNNVLDGSVTGEAITIKTTLTAASGNNLTLKGVIHNDGEIALQGGTLLAIDPTAGAALDGGGKVTLDDNPNNTIAGVGGAAATLDNVDNTISGSGIISGLTVINETGGTIDATGVNYQLVINNTDTLQNGGTLEATGAAGLNLSGQTIDAKLGGSIVVGDGSQIVISSDTFIGGTFAAVGSGKWVLGDPNNVLDGSVSGEAITNKTTLTAASGNNLTLKGLIHNDGEIALQGGTLLAIDPTAGVTLDGGGKVTLDDNPNNTIAGVGGAAATLDNVDNTISGSGSVSGLTVINETGGTIDATGTAYQLIITSIDPLQNSGVLEANGATLVVESAVTGDGHAVVMNGGVATFAGAFDENVSFDTGGGTLKLVGGDSGTITGFGASTSIDITNLAFASETQPQSVDEVGTSDDYLATFDEGGTSVQLTFESATALTKDSFVLSSDNASGTLITAPCYVSGTRILTVRGEVPVETLAVGDFVSTASGAHRPIVWIGHREVDLVRHPQPEEVRPVRIAAGALADNVPHRDLIVSPEHALWLGNALVPARDLINGATIRQEAWSRAVYFHVELESHDILLAEGAPAESYLDCDNRRGFDNAPVVDLHPNWRAEAEARPFAPLALAFRLRREFAARAVSLGRGAEVAAFETEQRARRSVTRTNFIRNPRGEGLTVGRLGEGGRAPHHWWFNTPDGITIAVTGEGLEDGKPFFDFRVVGRTTAPGRLNIHPDAAHPAPARLRKDFTASGYLRRIRGRLDGVEGIDLRVDELGAGGVYLCGQDFPQPLPTPDALTLQRMTATRRTACADATAAATYLQLRLAADTTIDFTLRIAGMQLEDGTYASDLILPPTGAREPATRSAPHRSAPAGWKLRAVG